MARLAALFLVLWAYGSEPPVPDTDPGRQESFDKLLKPIPAPTPEEARQAIELLPGCRLELAAAEPLVVDPVAAAFDEDGRLYVAEMIDYPFKPKDGDPPKSRVRLLVDNDDDGRFDTSHVFADKILWPAGIACWKGGIFVAAAPHIWYFKDRDGDGAADIRQIVFTGFGTQNQQAMVNNLAWSIDHWIYGSAAGNGGVIHRAGEKTEPVSIDGTDFRFDARSLRFEAITGRAQFGNTFDDWNNRFLCSESVPAYQDVLPRRYLVRNPDLPVPEAMKRLVPGVTPIYRSSPIEGWRKIRTDRRMQAQERDPSSAGASHHVLDGAAGATVYRGNAFPEWRGQLFVGDAQNNLVHRRRLEPEGVVFHSLRIDQKTEILRSRDNWFRPVNFVNAPDGSLLVLDMAREIIESIHIPTDVFQRIDLTRGRDRGRIFRIVPEAFRRPATPKLSSASTAELVSLLANSNAWHRDTAARLLLERQDKEAIQPLELLCASNEDPATRLAALFALEGQGAVRPEHIKRGLSDPAAEVRRHAVRLAEPFLNQDQDIRRLIFALAADQSPRVRFQVAFTLGECDGASKDGAEANRALASILASDSADLWIRTAVLSSSRGVAELLLLELLAARPPVDAAVLKQLAFLAGRQDNEDILPVVAALAKGSGGAQTALVLQGLAEGLRSRGEGFASLDLPATEARWLTHQFDAARSQLLGQDLNPVMVRRALAVIVFDSWMANREVLTRLFEQPDPIATLAIDAIGRIGDSEGAELLLTRFPKADPSNQSQILSVLLGRESWTSRLLDEIEAKKVSAEHLSFAQRSALRQHQSSAIRTRAIALFPDEATPRQAVINAYSAVIQRMGDATNGESVFVKNCSNCHVIGGKGFAVGPNLLTSRNRSPENLLTHILDPNREVQPAFAQHVIADTDGRILTGLLAAETPTSVTLTLEGGKTETILKANIQQHRNTGNSLMPEGLEKSVDEEAMADLIAYLVRMHYDIGSEPGYVEPTP